MHFKRDSLFRKTAIALHHLLLVVFITACGNSDDARKLTDAIEVNKLNISSLQLSSPNTVIEFDATEQFKAEAVIGDGSGDLLDVSNKVRWSVSDTDIAKINSSGLLTGKADGLITVTAKLADLSITKDLDLSSATLAGINILNNPTPVSACKSGYSLSAQGIYSDTTTRDITHLVDWSSNDSSLLAFSESGTFSTFKDGIATIKATRNTLAGSDTINIQDDISSILVSSPADHISIDSTLSFTAHATYNDTSTADVTHTVSWSSHDAATLAISNDEKNKGVATGVATGNTNIFAACLTTAPSISNLIAIEVKEKAVINGISIEEDATLKQFKLADSPEELVARLTKSDGSFGSNISDDEHTTWAVDETISGSPVTIDGEGELSFTEEGITKIQVRYYDSDNNVGPFTDSIEVEIIRN